MSGRPPFRPEGWRRLLAAVTEPLVDVGSSERRSQARLVSGVLATLIVLQASVALLSVVAGRSLPLPVQVGGFANLLVYAASRRGWSCAASVAWSVINAVVTLATCVIEAEGEFAPPFSDAGYMLAIGLVLPALTARPWMLLALAAGHIAGLWIAALLGPAHWQQALAFPVAFNASVGAIFAALIASRLRFERLREEERLAATETIVLERRRLLEAQRIGLIASFDYSQSSGLFRATPELAVLVGTDALGISDVDQFLAIVAPHDRDRLEAALKGAVSAEAAASLPREYRDRPGDVDDAFELRYEVVTPGGSIKTMDSRIAKVDGDGAPGDLLSVTVQDVSKQASLQRRLEKSLREKEVLLQEVHHRVKNNLQVVMSLLRMQLDTVESEETRRQLVRASSRVHSLAALHEHLYRGDNLSDVSARDHLGAIVGELCRSHDTEQRGVAVDLRVEPRELRIGAHVAIPVGLIVNELVSNALEHAFEGQGGGIWIELERSGSSLRLCVRDSGRGPAPGGLVARPGGLGLMLVEALASQLEGAFEIQEADGGGTAFEVEWPASYGERARLGV